MGSDRTLETDVYKLEDIQRHLHRSADRIARRLRSKGILAGGVRVRLKTTDFKLLTRQCTLASPTDVADKLFDTACQLLDRFASRGPFRLVGMAAHSLSRPSEPQQLDLLQSDPAKRNLEVVMDQVVERFGKNGIRRARDVGQSLVSESTPNLDFVSE
jgi:DNA polymerase-4